MQFGLKVYKVVPVCSCWSCRVQELYRQQFQHGIWSSRIGTGKALAVRSDSIGLGTWSPHPPICHIASPPIVRSFEGVRLCKFEPVSEEVITEIISKSPDKSCDLDPMPTSLVKSCPTELVPVIANIINASLLTGIVPAEIKHAMVKPLLKKSGLDPDDLKNF